MRVLWEEHLHEEDWGFILIDAWNLFNEENRKAMLWDVRHECPSDAQLTFNCYRHWSTLVVRDTGDRSGHFLHSKEGVTQGVPLAIIAYGIGVLPIIREIQGANTWATQPWYTDDTGAGGGGSFHTSWPTSRICRQGACQGATSRIRPRLSWAWPRGM